MRWLMIRLARRDTSVEFLFLYWVMLSDALTSVRTCSTSSDCNTSLGQSCYRHYEGCDVGRCMCDAKTTPGPGGQCNIVKLGNEACSSRDICHDGMYCQSGVCRCQSGSAMTSDGLYCLQPADRLLGHTCSRSENECFQKIVEGYTRSDVHCSRRGVCECYEGYKPVGVGCTHWNIGESGCVKSQHCSAGAVCVNGLCACPPDFKLSASGLKCEGRGAITSLPLGARCDEINDQSYCAQGLICHKCSKESNYKCVKFLMENEYAYLSSGSRSSWRSTQFVISWFVLWGTLSCSISLYYVYST